MLDDIQEKLGTGWYDVLKGEFDKVYMGKLKKFIEEQSITHTVYPPKNDIFNAYTFTPYEKIKVCIIGQDPYLNFAEAHGLAFSTYKGTLTPSLRQIWYAIKNQIYPDDNNYIWFSNLERWSRQGVFLLNTVLTVNSGISGSHKHQGWEYFTLETVKALDKRGGVVFLLWGGDARAFKPYIKGCTVLECEHPVAASYRKEIWNNGDCFNKCNDVLISLGSKEIIW